MRTLTKEKIVLRIRRVNYLKTIQIEEINGPVI